MTNALIVAIYAMACAAVGLALAAFGGLPLTIAALAGVVGFLFLSQVHAAFIRRRARRESERQIAGLKKSAKEFRATLQGYFLPASMLGMVGYLCKGLWAPAVTHYYLIALPATLPAILLGRAVNHRLRGDAFEKYIYSGLIAIVAVLLVQAMMI